MLLEAKQKTKNERWHTIVASFSANAFINAFSANAFINAFAEKEANAFINEEII